MSQTEKVKIEPKLDAFVEEGDLERAAKERPYKPCDNLRYELKICLLDTDCCRSGKTPGECLGSRHPSVPEECHKLRMQFFECKRSLIDMRTRFRGRKYD